MRTLRVEIKPSVSEIELDDYYDEDEEIDDDSLYEGFIYEIKTNPEYEWEIVTT